MSKAKIKDLMVGGSVIVIRTELALALGNVDKAIVLQQIEFLTTLPGGVTDPDGTHWIWNTYEQFHGYIPFYTASKIKRIILELEKEGLLISEERNRSRLERRKFYRVNTDQTIDVPNPDERRLLDDERRLLDDDKNHRYKALLSEEKEKEEEPEIVVIEEGSAENQKQNPSSPSPSNSKPNSQKPAANLLMEYRDASGETGMATKAFRSWFSNITSQYTHDDCLVAFQKLRNDIQTSSLKGMSKWERTQHHLRHPNVNKTRDKVNVEQAADEMKSLYSEAF